MSTEEIQQKEEKNNSLCVRSINGKITFEKALKCKCKQCGKEINLELNTSGLDVYSKNQVEYFMVYCSDCQLHTQTKIEIKNINIEVEIDGQ